MLFENSILVGDHSQLLPNSNLESVYHPLRDFDVGSFWGLLKNQLRNFSTPVIHYELPEIFTLPKIFEDFPKI